ncbi:hypothetical protein GPU89_02615 [Burkholderia cepacia]|nr:hypothetical protein [Burkholderia cepacia]
MMPRQYMARACPEPCRRGASRASRMQYAGIDGGVSIAAGRVIHAIHPAHIPQTISTATFSGVR